MGEAGHQARATRYALECPVRFRTGGADDWSAGTLKNISESGLFFVPGRHVADDAALEITIDLPPPGIGSIWCTAIVVRRETGTQSIGARITGYRLQPRGSVAASS